MTDLRIPGFEILGKIGEGGMATVWKARQLSLDRLVAIKVLGSKLASDPSELEHFREEARAAARLRHPGIVQVYDANISEGLCYFIMEYVAGYTVGDWIRRKGRIAEKDALVVADCVAHALRHAWDAERIVHCDIKPDNIIIDADGSVKVADLGLARSLRALHMKGGVTEIAGTPAYMSPEQVQGQAELDCRTDIYSLGATLYHMAVGKMLFEGLPADKVMELQVTGTVPSPTEIGIRVSPPFVMLMECMLAKHPGDRPPNWVAVGADIRRVQRRLPPLHRLKAGASSTMVVPRREKAPGVQKSSPFVEGDGRGARRAIAIGVATVVAVSGLLVGWLVFSRESIPARSQSKWGEHRPPYQGDLPPAAGDSDAGKMLERALQWIREHPGEETRGLEMLQAVVSRFRGSDYARQAEAEIRSLSARLDRECAAVLEELRRETDPSVEKGDFLKAAEVYALYEGRRAAETMVQRTLRANELRARHEEVERRRREEVTRLQEAVRATLAEVAARLLKEGIGAGLTRIQEGLSDESLQPVHTRFLSVKEFLEKALEVEGRVAASFVAQKGQEVTVQLLSGPCRLVITDVREGRVFGEQRIRVGDVVAGRAISFSLSELAAQEHLQRLGSDEEPEVALVKGLMATAAQRYSTATNYFGTTHADLRDFLIAMVSAKREDEASRSAGEEKVPPSVSREEVVEPVLVKDAEAILAALVSKNQGVARRDIRTEQDDKGNVFRITITSSQLVDLSPLAGLKTLRELRCQPDRLSGGGAKSRLQDLSPLKSLPLERLEVARSNVRDLRPLQGMPLKRLDVSDTEVSDLTPLQGMPLESLAVGNSKVRFLAPLAGMKLRSLDLRNLPLSDIRPLEGMPLQELNLDGVSVWDLTILAGMPLKKLVLSNTRFGNFSQLSGLPLEHLDLGRSLVRARDLTHFKTMPLKELDLSDTWVAEISALRDLPLERLSLARTPVRDFGPLRGCKLRSLDLTGTAVDDLSWLRDMPLRHLNISRTNVRDLSSLRDLSLVELDCRGIKATDFTPLMGTSIEVLWIDEGNLSPVMLRYLPRLRVLNGVDLRMQNIREWLFRDGRPRRRN